MTASVRVILEPLRAAGAVTLEDVAAARARLVRNGSGSSFASASPQPAELVLSIAAITKVRAATEREAPTPVASLTGTLRLDGPAERPIFELDGSDLVSLLSGSPSSPGSDDATPSTPPRTGVSLELDPGSFGENRTLQVPLPELGREVKTLELLAELKIGGSTESPPETNDRFDFNPFGPVEIVLPKVVALRFLTDHRVLRDNNTDFANSGNPFPKPEWQFGQASEPISHNKDARIRVRIDLEIFPLNAAPVDCDIVGVAGFAKLEFRLNVTLGGGKGQHILTSTEKLPDKVAKLVGEIAWHIEVKGKNPRTIKAGSSFGHVIYTTFGTPVDPGQRERGFTQRRMDKSVQLVGKTGTLIAHDMIQTLMKDDFPAFTLDEDDSVDASFLHPDYFQDVGGAWRILEQAKPVATCQALVRLVVAICKTVGLPGTYERILAVTDPDTGAISEQPADTGTGLSGVKRSFRGKQVEPFLTSKEPGKVGRTFEVSADDSPDLNVFEACLRFTDVSGDKRIYPGGSAGLVVLQINQAITSVFIALIWVLKLPDDPKQPGVRSAKLERIVKRFTALD